MYPGRRCNHDVNLLLRWPPTTSALAHPNLLDLIIHSMKAATYYVTDYSGKIQPHSHELWLHLHRGHARLEAELDDTNAPHPEIDPRYRASRGLLRMALSAEKKQHKSFQEMVATLLGEPESICSHSFQRLYYASTLSTACRAQPDNCASADLPAASVPGYIALPADTTGNPRPHFSVFFSCAAVTIFDPNVTCLPDSFRVPQGLPPLPGYLLKPLITNIAAKHSKTGLGTSMSLGLPDFVSHIRVRLHRCCIDLLQTILFVMNGYKAFSLPKHGRFLYWLARPSQQNTTTANGALLFCSSSFDPGPPGLPPHWLLLAEPPFLMPNNFAITSTHSKLRRRPSHQTAALPRSLQHTGRAGSSTQFKIFQTGLTEALTLLTRACARIQMLRPALKTLRRYTWNFRFLAHCAQKMMNLPTKTPPSLMIWIPPQAWSLLTQTSYAIKVFCRMKIFRRCCNLPLQRPVATHYLATTIDSCVYNNFTFLRQCQPLTP